MFRSGLPFFFFLLVLIEFLQQIMMSREEKQKTLSRPEEVWSCGQNAAQSWREGLRVNSGPSPVPNPRSGIFRTIGESTAGRHLDSVIRNIFKSNNQEDPVACFKERKNTMVTTASTVARRLVQEHKSV